MSFQPDHNHTIREKLINTVSFLSLSLTGLRRCLDRSDMVIGCNVSLHAQTIVYRGAAEELYRAYRNQMRDGITDTMWGSHDAD